MKTHLELPDRRGSSHRTGWLREHGEKPQRAVAYICFCNDCSKLSPEEKERFAQHIAAFQPR